MDAPIKSGGLAAETRDVLRIISSFNDAKGDLCLIHTSVRLSKLDFLTSGVRNKQAYNANIVPADERCGSLYDVSKSDQIPMAMRSIRFSYSFDEPITTPFNNTVTEIEFGPSFNTPVHAVRLRGGKQIDTVQWPTSLDKLVFGFSFHRPLFADSLPRGLKWLETGGTFCGRLCMLYCPDNLIVLRTGGRYAVVGLHCDRFADTIRYLELGCVDRGFPATCHVSSKMPASLEVLRIHSMQCVPPADVQWPEGLREIAIGGGINFDLLDLQLPRHLHGLWLGNAFNNPIAPFSFPPGLRRLFFGRDFNHPIDNDVLPETLEVLVFGNSFDQHLPRNGLPSGIRYLSFGTSFNKSLRNVVLPSALGFLRIDAKGYTHSRRAIPFPAGEWVAMFDGSIYIRTDVEPKIDWEDTSWEEPTPPEKFM